MIQAERSTLFALRNAVPEDDELPESVLANIDVRKIIFLLNVVWYILFDNKAEVQKEWIVIAAEINEEHLKNIEEGNDILQKASLWSCLFFYFIEPFF